MKKPSDDALLLLLRSRSPIPPASASVRPTEWTIEVVMASERRHCTGPHTPAAVTRCRSGATTVGGGGCGAAVVRVAPCKIGRGTSAPCRAPRLSPRPTRGQQENDKSKHPSGGSARARSGKVGRSAFVGVDPMCQNWIGATARISGTAADKMAGGLTSPGPTRRRGETHTIVPETWP